MLLVPEIQSLVPRHKADLDRVTAVRQQGYPAIAPILGELLGWMADSNWPVARPLSQYLLSLGEPIIEPVRLSLRGTDAIAKWHLIQQIMAHMPRSDASLLKDDLERLVFRPTNDDVAEEVHSVAREALEWLTTSNELDGL